jgi:mono/diheme cytochrome c family protein
MRKKCVFGNMALAIILAIGASTANSAETQTAPSGAGKKSASQIERGRYMAIVGGCNDCHTAGYGPAEGKIPEKQWLLGSGPLGYRGPWGTTYAANLRLTLSKMSEAEWVKFAKTFRTRPPMPWFNVNRWSDSDMRAFYRYVKQLGPVGEPVQAFVPPDKEPSPPFVQWPAPPKQN